MSEIQFFDRVNFRDQSTTWPLREDVGTGRRFDMRGIESIKLHSPDNTNLVICFGTHDNSISYTLDPDTHSHEIDNIRTTFVPILQQPNNKIHFVSLGEFHWVSVQSKSAPNTQTQSENAYFPRLIAQYSFSGWILVLVGVVVILMWSLLVHSKHKRKVKI